MPSGVYYDNDKGTKLMMDILFWFGWLEVWTIYIIRVYYILHPRVLYQSVSTYMSISITGFIGIICKERKRKKVITMARLLGAVNTPLMTKIAFSVSHCVLIHPWNEDTFLINKDTTLLRILSDSHVLTSWNNIYTLKHKANEKALKCQPSVHTYDLNS